MDLIKNATISGHKGATIYRDAQGRVLRVEKDEPKGLLRLGQEHRQADFTYTTDEDHNQIQTEIYSINDKIQNTTVTKYDKNGKIIDSLHTEADGSSSYTKYNYDENGKMVGRYVDKNNDGKVDSYITGDSEYVYLNNDNEPDLLNVKSQRQALIGKEAHTNTFISKSIIDALFGSVLDLFSTDAHAANGKEREFPDVSNLNHSNFLGAPD